MYAPARRARVEGRQSCEHVDVVRPQPDLFLGLAERRREKIDVARGLGCDAVIDASSEDWIARARVLSPRGYEVVLDANGASTLRASFELLGAPGRLVIYGFHSMLPRGRGRPSLTQLARTWLATPRFDPLAMTGTNRSVLALNLSYLFEQRAMVSEVFDQLERNHEVERGGAKRHCFSSRRNKVKIWPGVFLGRVRGGVCRIVQADHPCCGCRQLLGTIPVAAAGVKNTLSSSEPRGKDITRAMFVPEIDIDVARDNAFARKL